ncbi:BURP domain-containing protein 5-like [Mercurialis annua]|uniref:BURP domain-containing protein 5-like n=1 Tax=Mercurialis annua TaxID=3986 RepID=UPI00215F75B0|nr:BURP domain-containing protein 5-like [Mercurialis annua]
MEFHLILIFTLSLLFSSNGALPEEMYWKSKLPNTPLPKALQELLQPTGNISSFAEVKLIMDGNEGFRATYGIGYRISKLKTFSGNDIMHNDTITYFLYNHLHPNQRMKLIFTKSIKESKFLPHQIAESIPFSTKKTQQILDYFSIKPTSEEAHIIKQTIKQCEAPNVLGEDKYCATSFESLVDFVTAKLGSNITAFSNEVEEENKKQEYTILKDIKMIGDKQIVCHKLRYKYAVFYCHAISATKAYMVPMVGDDGSKAKAIVVCHFDTSAWNSDHLAFQVLNMKPGGSPICHFLNTDTIVWVPV